MKILRSVALGSLGAACAFAAAVVPSLATNSRRAVGAITLSSPHQALEFETRVSAARGTVSYHNVDAGVDYTTQLTCVNDDASHGDDIWFSHTIPPGHGSLSGLGIMWKTTAGGTSAGFAVFPNGSGAVSACNAAAAPTATYTITAGTVAFL